MMHLRITATAACPECGGVPADQQIREQIVTERRGLLRCERCGKLGDVRVWLQLGEIQVIPGGQAPDGPKR